MKFQSNVVLRRVQKRKDQAGSIALLSSHRHRDSLRSIIHLLANHRCTRSVKIVACLSPLHNPRRSIDVRVNEPTSEQGGAWFVFRYMEPPHRRDPGIKDTRKVTDTHRFCNARYYLCYASFVTNFVQQTNICKFVFDDRTEKVASKGRPCVDRHVLRSLRP